MLVATKVNDFQTGGALNARKSTMELSAKTFKMQIDSIYSDKIGAPVRELASNAWDSHLRAGTERPFYVQVPTPLHPEFAVRDYGSGMTDAIMENVYIVLGRSDKEQTNKEVGMWGLGSKSPFAYTDQYTISCYDGETVRHYGYGLAEDEIPTLYTMDIQPCDEPRGVRVAFSVEDRDFQAFEKAVRLIAVAHENAFETNITLADKADCLFKGDDWYALTDSVLPVGWYARQGCVIYPLDRAQVEYPNPGWDSKYRFILDCPIGTVKVTPSRESIEYVEEVTDYLKSRVANVIETVKDAIWDQIKDIGSVQKFFAQAAALKPSFVSAEFTHPATGLKTPLLSANAPQAIFTISQEDQGRWAFEQPTTLAIDDKSNYSGRHFLVMNEALGFLDPSRGEVKPTVAAWLSTSEQRRLSRFARAYMEKNGIQRAVLLMNYEHDAAFWTACFPKAQVESITFETLRDTMPRRIVPPTSTAKPPIRGLALAKAAGEQKPVFEINTSGGLKYAWISSAQHRRQAGALFRLAKRFNVDALYIAAPQVQHMMTEAAIPHLREAIDKSLVAQETSFADWYYSKDTLEHYTIRPYVEYLRALLPNTAAYDRLAKGSGAYSTVARQLQRLLRIPESEIKEEEKKALEALLVNEHDTVIKPPRPPEAQALSAILTHMQGSAFYSNPAYGLFQNVRKCEDKVEAMKIVNLILYLQKNFPLSTKA